MIIASFFRFFCSKSQKLRSYARAPLGRSNPEPLRKRLDEVPCALVAYHFANRSAWVIGNFKQSFESDKYVKAFLAQLDSLEIAYKASEAIAFVTPRDSIIKRKGVQTQ